MSKHLKKTQRVIDKEFLEFTEEDIRTQVEIDSIELYNTIEKAEQNFNEFYSEQLLEIENAEFYDKKISQFVRSYRRASVNMLKAYQKLESMRDELASRWKEIRKSKKKNIILPNIPANSEIDYTEKKLNHFAQGINIYKMIFICFIGSFAGVVIEMIWCLLRNGYIESRAGLVYGPFNLLYGVGAMALSLALYKYRNRGGWLSFLGGMFVGSLVEYLCSLFQEILLGSRSWDYSGMPFNINGRICLLYSVFWGLLGYWWIKFLYPLMAKLILKIPNRVGKVLSYAIVVFFVFNGVVTLLASFRWAQRIDGILPSNAFWEFIDSRFTEERMSKIFANMEF